MKKSKINKPLLALPLATLCLAGPFAQAAEVKAYGRVLYNMISDDTSEDLYFGRHEFAESTIGIKGTTKAGSIIFSAQVEIGLNEGVSTLLQNGNNSRNRIQELSIGGSFGTFKLGTGPSVTWVVSDVDQSGTWWSDPLGMSARFGSTRRGPSGQSQTPFVQAQSIFNERLRYDSPKIWNGLTLHAQVNEDSGAEVALKYADKSWRFTAWSADHGDGDDDSDPQANVDGFTTNGFFGAEKGTGVLGGYKHSSGVNFTATTMVADQLNGGERTLAAAKLGYTHGKHAVSYSMGAYESEDSDGVSGPDHDRSTVAYNFSATDGVKLWVQYTEGETDGEESFDAVAVGGMVKF